MLRTDSIERSHASRAVKTCEGQTNSMNLPRQAEVWFGYYLQGSIAEELVCGARISVQRGIEEQVVADVKTDESASVVRHK